MGKVESFQNIVTSHLVTNNFQRKLVTSHLVTNNQGTTKRNKLDYSSDQAKQRADYLVQKLKNPSRRMFYLKCAWNLTDDYLDRLLGISLTKTNPQCYFSKSAAQEMANNG